MKKILLSVLAVGFLMSPYPMHAQVDTIRGKVPYLHYNYYDSTWCQSRIVNAPPDYHSFPYCIFSFSRLYNMLGEGYTPPSGSYPTQCYHSLASSEVAIRMEMDAPALMSGIAFGYDTRRFIGNGCSLDSCFIEENSANVAYPRYWVDDYIFNVYDAGMNLICSDTVPTEEFHIDFYMEAGFDENKITEASHHWYTTGQGGYVAPGYFGLCKIMFDTAIYVPDTFFVGITSTTPISVYNGNYDTAIMITSMTVGSIHAHSSSLINFTQYDLSLIPHETRRYRISQSSGEAIQDWADEECHYGVQTCLYPILVLPCNNVTNLRYEPLGSTGTIAFVQWDGEDNHAGYEISYGPHGTPPGEGTVIQTRIPQTVLSQLNRTTRYDVYVRARCEYDTTRWSAWSDTLHMHIATYGIDDVEAPEVTLAPNPTTGTLTVRCGAEIEGVELYDMQGRVVSGQWSVANGQCVVLDLAALPAGSYTVVVRTAKGMTAKQVVVQ